MSRLPPATDAELDPVYRHARREALVILLLWLAMLCWAVPYCYLNGWLRDGEAAVETVWGIPAWTFWGIVVPWLVADLFTVWFCFAYMVDDDLGVAPEDEDRRTEDTP